MNEQRPNDEQKKFFKIEILKNYDSMSAFAAAFGIHYTKLSMVLNGYRPFNEDEGKAISKHLKCDYSIIAPFVWHKKGWEKEAERQYEIARNKKIYEILRAAFDKTNDTFDAMTIAFEQSCRKINDEKREQIWNRIIKVYLKRIA
jgi:hypothetical protein